MTGKVVMVTGANGGLGASVTRALLEAGATVVGVSRHIAQSDFSHAGFTALAGEISIVGAICAGQFSMAHERLGRAPGG